MESSDTLISPTQPHIATSSGPGRPSAPITTEPRPSLGTSVIPFHAPVSGPLYDDDVAFWRDTASFPSAWPGVRAGIPSIQVSNAVTRVAAPSGGAEEQYLNSWRARVRPRMPDVFMRIDDYIQRCEAIKLAVLALASLDAEGSQQPHSEGVDTATGLDYYGRALQLMATANHEEFGMMDIFARLVTVLLFAYIELRSGTIAGRACHIIKFGEILEAHGGHVMGSSLGVRLVMAWAFLRAHLVMDCQPHKRRALVSAYEGSRTQLVVERYVELTSSTDTFLALRLASLSHASDLLLLHGIVGQDSSSAIHRCWLRCLDETGAQGSEPADVMLKTRSPTALLGELDAQRALLDSWEASQPLDSQPIETFSSADVEHADLLFPGLVVKPLRFTSHQAAMRYLQYVCAQLFASHANIAYCARGGPAHGDAGDIDPWVRLLLRILASLDFRQCVTENAYGVSAAWIAARAALRSCSVEVLTWIENWLEKLATMGGPREGVVPVGLLLQVVSEMVRLYEDGKTVSLIIPNIKGDKEKRDLLRVDGGQLQYSIVVHGRTRLQAARGRQAAPFVDRIDFVPAAPTGARPSTV